MDSGSGRWGRRHRPWWDQIPGWEGRDWEQILRSGGGTWGQFHKFGVFLVPAAIATSCGTAGTMKEGMWYNIRCATPIVGRYVVTQVRQWGTSNTGTSVGTSNTGTSVRYISHGYVSGVHLMRVRQWVRLTRVHHWGTSYSGKSLGYISLWVQLHIVQRQTRVLNISLLQVSGNTYYNAFEVQVLGIYREYKRSPWISVHPDFGPGFTATKALD